MRTVLATLVLVVLALGTSLPVAARADPLEARPTPVRLTDAELAQVTGKFFLSNGVELALTVNSDTVLNGQLVLRTVLTVDKTASLQVLGRQPGSAGVAYEGSTAVAPSVGSITVSLDRQSGIQTVTPSFTVASGPAVTVGGNVPTAAALGLVNLPLSPGGPAVATADGVVSLESVRNGSRVTFAGDQFSVVNQLGQSVVTALVNSADNRTIDTVTNVTIDARNIAPYQAGMAQLRVDALALDAARGILR